jgi:hypothetical protein
MFAPVLEKERTSFRDGAPNANASTGRLRALKRHAADRGLRGRDQEKSRADLSALHGFLGWQRLPVTISAPAE